MQRRQMERGPDRRRKAERDASQPIDNQPDLDDDDPENAYVPAFFTTPEFQARDPADERRASERRGCGSLKATVVKPLGSDDEPLGGE